MKELSIEEKAKAYDEAKARMSIAYNSNRCTIGFMNEIFPEPKESEDERIRKTLINGFNKLNKSAVWYNGVTNGQILAWLEKQCDEQNLTLPKWKYKKDNTPLLKDSLILNKYGCVAKSPSGALVSDVWVIDYAELAKLPKEEIEKQSEQKPIKVYRVENEAEQKGLWRKFDGTWQPLFDMLTDGKCKDMPMEDSPIYREGGKRWFASAPSKETLQKWFSKIDLEELVSKGFTISEFEVVGYKKVSDFEYIFTRDNIINRNYLEVSDIYSERKDFAQNVEPKFKIGQWIVWQDKCYKVNYNGCGYELVDQDGLSTSLEYGTIDENARLWDITKDAKDGDVLYINNTMSESIMIYKSFNNGVINKYASYNKFGFEGENYLTLNDGYIIPATKEQRDLLFQKIKEAGFEWDAEKKELKKEKVDKFLFLK